MNKQDDPTSPDWPENFERLFQKEEALRREAIAVLLSDPISTKHVRVTETAMDTIMYFLNKHITSVEDELTVQLLGVRLFNAAATSQKLALSGYVQNAAAIQRDILETGFLLNFFASFPEEVQRWRAAKEAERNKVFGPAAVRKRLDERDGFKARQREADYKAFCQMASHPQFCRLRPTETERGTRGNWPFP
jgi:hypothetical protein